MHVDVSVSEDADHCEAVARLHVRGPRVLRLGAGPPPPGRPRDAGRGRGARRRTRPGRRLPPARRGRSRLARVGARPIGGAARLTPADRSRSPGRAPSPDRQPHPSGAAGMAGRPPHPGARAATRLGRVSVPGQTVVFVHAHPDDEAIFTGGTMRRLGVGGSPGGARGRHRGRARPRARGRRSRRGRAAALAAQRTAETEAAAALLGVARVAWLGYHDSGMAGDPANDAPGSFWSADLADAADQLAAVLREEEPAALVGTTPTASTGTPTMCRSTASRHRAATAARGRHRLRRHRRPRVPALRRGPPGRGGDPRRRPRPRALAHRRGVGRDRRRRRRPRRPRGQAGGDGGPRQPDPRVELRPPAPWPPLRRGLRLGVVRALGPTGADRRPRVTSL